MPATPARVSCALMALPSEKLKPRVALLGGNGYVGRHAVERF